METEKKNWRFIVGILIMCVGMQFANYGTALCLSGEMARMNATAYYVLVSAMGSMGMMLILPVVGKLTAIMGQRNMIICGIAIQFLGRVLMMLCDSWVPFMLAFLLQSVGGGFYISSAHVNMATAVPGAERSKFFGYIAMANAVGAISGPILASKIYALGGMVGKLAFIANLPITLVGFAMIFKECSNRKNPVAAKGFDYFGLTLTVVGLASLVLWLNLGGKMFQWTSLPSILLLFLGGAAMFLAIRRETTIPNPAVPVKMFRNKRLTYAFICAMVASAYASCSASYSAMWIRLNYIAFPSGSLFAGTATLPQQVVILVLGLFLGAWVGRKFVTRFRIVGVASMVAAMLATAILFCLRFTGTAAGGDMIMLTDGLPLGMVLIYIATAIGGFTSVISQSTYSTFWQSNTSREEIPTGQALYTFGSTGGSVVFGAVAGLVLGSSGDYSRVFATGFCFAVIGFVCSLVGFRFSKEEVVEK